MARKHPSALVYAELDETGAYFWGKTLHVGVEDIESLAVSSDGQWLLVTHPPCDDGAYVYRVAMRYVVVLGYGHAPHE